ncbi:MAG: hypothetical protein ACXAD7_27270, partial [Candidatus Kariarchaeaceae archaeon]
GVEVTFFVQYLDVDGTLQSFEKNATTGDNGIAQITIPDTTTEIISEIVDIRADIFERSDTSLGGANLPVDDFPQIKAGSTDFEDWWKSTLEFIVENLNLVLIILAVILTLIVFIRRQVKKRRTRIRILAMESESATEEIAGLLSIHAILLKNTRSGLPFYETIFEESLDAHLDLTLISGLTTAITSFLNEVKEDIHGFETMERSGLSITSHKGEVSTLIIISGEQLPLCILDQVKNGHIAIEKEFKNKISNEALIEGVHPDLIEDRMERNYLKISLKRNLKINSSKFQKVQKMSSITRNIRSNMKVMKEFWETTAAANVPITLKILNEYLIGEGISREIVSKMFILSYGHELIEADYYEEK